MKNKVINIIRPRGNAAEKEYLKEFFRFIGCFLSDQAVDTGMMNAWGRSLRPKMEPGGVDIVMNYFGEDPYQVDCEIRGNTRIYCYFSFKDGYGYVTDTPLADADLILRVRETESTLRRWVMNELILRIWKYEPEAMECVQRIAGLYTSVQGGLFYHIQTRRCLRFLGMDEVLQEPNAHVSMIRYTPAVRRALTGLWRMWMFLTPYNDAYSRYTQIKAAKMVHDIAGMLPVPDLWKKQVPSMKELTDGAQKLVEENPEFLSAYLLLAGLCRYVDRMYDQGESCYMKVLQSVPKESRYYAFVWYRLGRFYEKTYHAQPIAKEFYQRAVAADSEYYQALFKLGHCAAVEARYDEAEHFLLRAIRAIFRSGAAQYAEDEAADDWDTLSQKEVQYLFKTYILLAKIAIKTNREYSAKDFIGDACIAAMVFERATLINRVSDGREFISFWRSHRLSEPVWAMWKILERWTEDIIFELYLRDIVREKLKKWSSEDDE